MDELAGYDAWKITYPLWQELWVRSWAFDVVLTDGSGKRFPFTVNWFALQYREVPAVVCDDFSLKMLTIISLMKV